jgi:prolyl-tRNA synthetase
MGKEGKQMDIPLTDAPERIVSLLKKMQEDLFNRAKASRDKWTGQADSYDEFKTKIEAGGFLLAHWDGTRETEDKIQEETKATIRCIPFDREKEAGKCMVTGKPSEGRVVFARAY